MESSATTGRPGEAGAPALGVVIVNYESGDHLRRCVASLHAALGGIRADLVVVDNGSSDGSAAGVDARVISSPQNVGYGSACNLGASATSSPLILFLNPDVQVYEPSLQELTAAAKRLPRAGILGPRIDNSDGTIYPSCRVFPGWGTALGHAFLGMIAPSNRFSREYKMLDWDHAEQRRVDWVSGSAMLVRREVFDQVGGFDERFFMYVEDVDLCDRVSGAGWDVIYYPDAKMLHHLGASSRKSPYRMIAHHHMSLLRFAARKSRGKSRLALLPLVAIGLLLRVLLAGGAYLARTLFEAKR